MSGHDVAVERDRGGRGSRRIRSRARCSCGWSGLQWPLLVSARDESAGHLLEVSS